MDHGVFHATADVLQVSPVSMCEGGIIVIGGLKIGAFNVWCINEIG
jgi:hypothetical protein